MQTVFRPVRRGDRGFALLITMIFLGVSLLIFASMMFWISSNAKVTIRNNQYNMSSGAAEAAVETVLAQMDRDFLNQSLTNGSYYATLPIPTTGWSTAYTFSDTNGVANQISVALGTAGTNAVPLNSQYVGLYGLAQNCTIVATATPTIQSGVTAVSVPAIVSESLQFAAIPIFQFAIFYNIDLEICPGQPMLITGPVFSNAGIWAGSQNTTFSNTVTAVGSVVNTTKIDQFNTSYDPQNGGPTFMLPGQPTVRNDPLVMPIGTNNNPAAVRGIVNLPPTTYANGTAAAYSTNGELYLMNAADLIISNSPGGTASGSPIGTNIFVFFQDPSAAKYLTPLAYDFYKLRRTAPNGFYTNNVSTNVSAGIDSSTNVVFAGYSFLTNVLFYDWREGLNSGNAKAVQAVQIDIKMFNAWLTNTAASGGNAYNQKNIDDKGHWVDSMYVYNAVSNTPTTLPAVRVIHGQQLASSYGFTVVTPFPMYVYGDYNSQTSHGSSLGVNTTGLNAWPAAFMADSITVLSDGWNDATTTIDPSSAANTTVNAAMLEGIVPSNPAVVGVSYSGPGYSGSYSGYSGGVENFLRLLESWNNNTVLTYNGSIVVMFPSQYATNYWAGDYYGVPSRNWAFDTNFKTQAGLPPLTPESKAMIRGQWLAQKF